MRTVTSEEAAKAWNEVCDMEEEQSRSVAKKFFEEQPHIGLYVSTVLKQTEGCSEDSPVIELVIACWMAMSGAAGRILGPVDLDELEEAEEQNTERLLKTADATEGDLMSLGQDFMNNYNQWPLLAMALEILVTSDGGDEAEEESENVRDSVGLEWMWVKTVVDCLDRA